jgi:lipoate-protein ligase B
MAQPATTRYEGPAAAAALEVRLLGLVDFDAALALQERLVYELSGRDDAQGALLLCEHPPLITLGREASAAQITADPDDLRTCEIDVRWVARGGGTVIHAPGQLAVYPVLPLARLGLGLNEFRTRLEEAAVAVCRDMRVPVKRRPSEPGVWSRCGQVASFGAAVKSWVSYHGLFLNVDPDPSFLPLVAGNPGGERPTSLQALLLRPVSMAGVRESVIRHVAERFGYARFHIYTGHPWLKRTTQKVCVHA